MIMIALRVVDFFMIVVFVLFDTVKIHSTLPHSKYFEHFF